MTENCREAPEGDQEATLPPRDWSRDDVLIVNVDLGEQSEVLSELIKEAKASDAARM